MDEPLPPLPARWTRPSATELRNLRFAIADPGAFLRRLKLGDDEYESIPAWSARAVQSVVDPAMDTAHAAGVTEGRRQAAEAILAQARALQSDMDITPDQQADPAVGGEIEGLWSAARIADEQTWRAAYDPIKPAGHSKESRGFVDVYAQRLTEEQEAKRRHG